MYILVVDDTGTFRSSASNKRGGERVKYTQGSKMCMCVYVLFAGIATV